MTLVSPGVETSLTDDSLFTANAASLVPLFFIATQDEKTLSNGEAAAGTYEHSTVRSITSLRQSISFYGTPAFLNDGSGNQQHGDARNEYGLYAMNQYLTIGNAAYCVRANVNLNDDIDDIQAQWDAKSDDASIVIQNVVQNYINNVNLANGITSSNVSVLKNVSNRIPSTQLQTQAEYDGELPYGFATVGTVGGAAVNFEAGDVITMSDGITTVRIDSVDDHLGATDAGVPSTFTVTKLNEDLEPGTELTIGQVVTADGQIAFDNGTIPLGGSIDAADARSGFTLTPELANFMTFIQTDQDYDSFTGGSNYRVDDVISMSNSSLVKVVSVDSAGAVETFAVITTGNTVVADRALTAVKVTPANTTAPQTGFTMTVTESNLESQKTTVTGEELMNLVSDATNFIFDENDGVYAFRDLGDDFLEAKSDSDDNLVFEFLVYSNGFDFDPTYDAEYTTSGNFVGFNGLVALGVAEAGAAGNDEIDAWTPAEASDLFGSAATSFKFTQPFFTKSSLGANDAARRVSIVAALQSAIVSNTDVRSENFQFNVVACPGYPEVVDELLSLSVDQKSEVLVVGDTPPNLSPEAVTNPTNGWATTTARQNSTNVCYYYPWCFGSNLDGVNVLAAPSGTAIRQMAYNDNISYLWYAPAGTTRGLVSGVTDVGYALGTLGEGTTFKPVALNQGQRDALYQDVPSGRMNPIVFQPGKGIVLMGQKTSAPSTTALDRINVVRLTMHVRRQLRLTTVNFLFEPNDNRTRDNVKAVADNFLGTIMANRGIVDFLTVCDESNNTSDVVDRNELILDVLVKPMKSLEFISIPIRIVTQGTNI